MWPWARRRHEARLLAKLRSHLADRNVPVERLSDDDLRQGVRRVIHAIDDGRLTPEDCTYFRAARDADEGRGA